MSDGAGAVEAVGEGHLAVRWSLPGRHAGPFSIRGTDECACEAGGGWFHLRFGSGYCAEAVIVGALACRLRGDPAPGRPRWSRFLHGPVIRQGGGRAGDCHSSDAKLEWRWDELINYKETWRRRWN